MGRLGAVIHTCSRNQSDLDASLRQWRSAGFKVTGSARDVSSPADREMLMEEVKSTFDGKLNILVGERLDLKLEFSSSRFAKAEIFRFRFVMPEPRW